MKYFIYIAVLIGSVLTLTGVSLQEAISSLSDINNPEIDERTEPEVKKTKRKVAYKKKENKASSDGDSSELIKEAKALSNVPNEHNEPKSSQEQIVEAEPSRGVASEAAPEEEDPILEIKPKEDEEQDALKYEEITNPYVHNPNLDNSSDVKEKKEEEADSVETSMQEPNRTGGRGVSLPNGAAAVENPVLSIRLKAAKGAQGEHIDDKHNFVKSTESKLPNFVKMDSSSFPADVSAVIYFESIELTCVYTPDPLKGNDLYFSECSDPEYGEQSNVKFSGNVHFGLEGSGHNLSASIKLQIRQ